MASSQLYPDEVVVDDATPYDSLVHPDGPDVGRGLDLGLRGPGEYAYGDVAQPFPQELLVPESDWRGMIEEMEATKSRVSDLIRMKKLDHKDQGQTNYCWINAPVHCVEILRLQQNQERVTLSPASAGAQIKNFRNYGGWGKEGLEFIVERGVVPVEHWPANAIDRKYLTPANIELGKKYRVTEWWELRPRNKAEMISLLLRRQVAAAGYNWWRHEVTAVEPVWLDGDVALRIRNSWKGYGDYGFAVIQGSRMLADDIVAPRVATAS